MKGAKTIGVKEDKGARNKVGLVPKSVQRMGRLIRIPGRNRKQSLPVLRALIGPELTRQAKINSEVSR